MVSKIKFAQLQTPICHARQKNLDYAAAMMERPEAKDADFVTLPEMFTTPYVTTLFPIYAEPEGGPSWQFCSNLAKKHGVYLSSGTMPERGEDGKIYNTGYVFDRSGRQIAKARKTHLFDVDLQGGQKFRESDTLSAGDWIETFDTEFCRMGLCVCFDIRFPEVARFMAQEGATVILVPAAFNLTTGPAHWELTLRARAVENQCWTLGTAPSRDMKGPYHSWGHSIAVDPWGDAIQLDEKEGILSVEVDLEKVESVRQGLPLMSARRTDIYRLEGNLGKK